MTSPLSRFDAPIPRRIGTRQVIQFVQKRNLVEGAGYFGASIGRSVIHNNHFVPLVRVRLRAQSLKRLLESFCVVKNGNNNRHTWRARKGEDMLWDTRIVVLFTMEKRPILQFE